MTEFESRLREVLEDKAGSMSADRTRHRHTMRRARMRRAGTAAFGVAVLLAVAAGSVGMVRSFADPQAFDPAGPDQSGEAHSWGWDGSISNEYPEIGRGSFNGREWVLEGTRGSLGEGIDKVDLEITIEGADDTSTESVSMEVVPSDEVLQSSSFELDTGSGRVVYGAALNSVHSVEAMLEDGTAQEALIFTGYDSHSTITAQYFVLFLPADQEGYLFARDPLGVDLEREPIGNARAVAGKDRPLVSGSFDGRPWSVEPSRRGIVSCLAVAWGQAQGEGCYTDNEGGTLLLRAVDLGGGAKALLGFQPTDHSNLQIEIGDRMLSLHSVLEPDEHLGFPFAVVVADDAHGTITSTDDDGKEVPFDF